MSEHYLINHIKQYIQIDTEAINILLLNIDIRKIRKNEQLFTSGQICNHLYFVTKGLLKKYYVNSEGKERVLTFTKEMQWNGDLTSFWNNEKTIFNIKALETTEYISISRTKIDEVTARIPAFDRYLRMIANESIYKLERRVNQSLSCSAEERYMDFLEDYGDLVQRIPQKEIASFLGVTPEFLSIMKGKILKS